MNINLLKNNTEIPLKLVYTTPKISLLILELEEGLAAGSATVRSQDAQQNVLDEWDVQPDDTRNIDW